MGSKIKRQDGTIQEVNPHELFNRPISLALVCPVTHHSEEQRIEQRFELKDILCYELPPFPPELFESE